jgi:glycosyltransferase involved in cell wall biosynthesis
VSVILAHPTGNANVRAALRGLHGAGLLSRFVTTLNASSFGPISWLTPPALRREVGKRAYPDVPERLVRQVLWRELARLAALRLGWAQPVRHERGWASVDAVYRGVDRAVAAAIRSGELAARGVYTYEDGALETLRAAGERGMRRIYEIPSPYWPAVRTILEEEAELRPAWASTLEGLRDSPEKLARKNDELDLADAVIVPCAYARECLVRHRPADAAKVRLLPYGAPAVGEAHRPPKACEPLRIIYVGQMRQRKGIAYLFEAVERLDRPYRLTLLGSRPAMSCLPLERALERHRWVPHLPHPEAIGLMRQHDVLVFPSLCEGFGLVILEAMSQGVPVITTPHTGGPDVIEDGTDGFIVPIRDPDAIADRLTLLADDRDRLAAMGEAACYKATDWSWSRYERELVALVRPWLT